MAVRAIAEREGLDLASCYAYSDSSNDLPMLSLVGHPCAVNPDARLLLHAKAQGWDVRDYRTGRKLAVAGGKAAALGGAALATWKVGSLLRRPRRGPLGRLLPPR